MKKTIVYEELLVAPCGINCGTCLAYLRPINRCLGCRVDFPGKRKTCSGCKIKNCEFLSESKSGFCYDCDSFPCEKMRHIDKRYRSKYRSGLIENLVSIQDKGITTFLKLEAEKWACPYCGAATCIHRYECPKCKMKLN